MKSPTKIKSRGIKFYSNTIPKLGKNMYLMTDNELLSAISDQ